jgi:hypothetical protein
LAFNALSSLIHCLIILTSLILVMCHHTFVTIALAQRHPFVTCTLALATCFAFTLPLRWPLALSIGTVHEFGGQHRQVHLCLAGCVYHGALHGQITSSVQG